MGKIVVRIGEEGDEQVLVEFNYALAVETESKLLDKSVLLKGVKAVIRNPYIGRYYVLTLDSEIVASLMITYEWIPDKNKHAWWIQSVYVRPDHRRKGYYRRLYEHVEQQAVDQGVESLKLYADVSNEQARSAYSKLGMVETGKVLESEGSAKQ